VGSQLRLIFISILAVLGALVPASSSAAPDSAYVHDVKVFHQVAGKASRPQPAEIAVLVGGEPIGKMIPGLKGGGKHFAIINVKGGRVALARHTGPNARVSLQMAGICRDNPDARYYLRATARIGGKLRRGYIRGGDCSFVKQVLDRGATAITRTTFIFEN
jgi:hypothetical protein